MSAADILRLDLDSQAVDPKMKVQAALSTSASSTATSHKVRPDVNAVVHSHSSTVVPFTVTRAKPAAAAA